MKYRVEYFVPGVGVCSLTGADYDGYEKGEAIALAGEFSYGMAIIRPMDHPTPAMAFLGTEDDKIVFELQKQADRRRKERLSA